MTLSLQYQKVLKNNTAKIVSIFVILNLVIILVHEMIVQYLKTTPVEYLISLVILLSGILGLNYGLHRGIYTQEWLNFLIPDNEHIEE